MANKPSRLGKGLDALLGDFAGGEALTEVRQLDVTRVEPNPFQPRRDFDEERLQELTDSIRVHGVVQPVIVRRAGSAYQLVAGERRWRAAQAAGLTHIPAVEAEYSDRDLMEVALIENLQREDLGPMEQATAYQVLQREFALTQNQLAERLGLSRSQIANVLRLLTLPESVQGYLRSGDLSLGHAKVVLGVPEDQRAGFSDRLVQQGLSVREAEALAKEWPPRPPVPRRSPTDQATEDVFLADVERRLSRGLSAPVRLRARGAGRGRIAIEYQDLDDLQRLLQRLLGDEGGGDGW